MELSHLRYAVMLAKTNHFSKAAEQLYITQPTLSQQINGLEKELGLRLFDRTTRKVTLTDAGKKFVADAQDILDRMDKLTMHMETFRRKIRGTLSIGLLNTLSQLNIPEYIGRFRAEYPNVEIEMQIGSSERLISQVLDDELDVAFVNIYALNGERMDSRLKIEPFLEDHLVVLANRESPLAKRDSVTLEDLRSFPIIGLGRDTSIRRQMDDLFASMTDPPHIICTCPELSSMTGMIRGGLGITLASSTVAEQYMAHELIYVPLFPVVRTMSAMVTNTESSASPVLRFFEDFFYGIVH